MVPIEVTRRFFYRVWTQEDAGAIDEMLVPDSSARGLGGAPRIGPDEFKALHAALLRLVGDVEIAIEDHADSGDWTFAICTFRARVRGTGKPVEIGGQIYLRVENDCIVEAYNNWDFMALFEQLGLLPDGVFERCLSGERVG